MEHWRRYFPMLFLQCKERRTHVMNSWNVSGKLKELELRHSKKGEMYAILRVVVKRPGTFGENLKYDSFFFKAFGSHAKLLSKLPIEEKDIFLQMRVVIQSGSFKRDGETCYCEDKVVKELECLTFPKTKEKPVSKKEEEIVGLSSKLCKFFSKNF